MRNRLLVPVAAALALSGMTLSPHHSVAAVYDTERLVTLVGVIARVSVANPHLTVDLKVTSPDGAETTWRVEMAPTGALKLKGFDPQVIKTGEQVVIESWLHKDGRNEASGRWLTIPDGRRFSVGDGWMNVTERTVAR